jgi:aspartyl protease family protein
MALRPGTKLFIREAASWTVVVVIGIAAFSHFEELKTGAERMFGLPTATDAAKPRDEAGDTDGARVGVARMGPVVEIEAGRHGHFNTDAEINGRTMEVMVDTGASMVALTYEDAERAGIYLNHGDFTQAVSTANGVARFAPVRLTRVAIGDILIRDVPAAVAERGRLKTSLLGMSFLSRLSRFDMRSGTLVLQE